MYATINVYNPDATIGIRAKKVDGEEKIAVTLATDVYLQLSFTEARQLIKRLSEVMADEA